MKNHELKLLLLKININIKNIINKKYKIDYSYLKILLRDCLYTIIMHLNLLKEIHLICIY